MERAAAATRRANDAEKDAASLRTRLAAATRKHEVDVSAARARADAAEKQADLAEGRAAAAEARARMLAGVSPIGCEDAGPGALAPAPPDPSGGAIAIGDGPNHGWVRRAEVDATTTRLRDRAVAAEAKASELAAEAERSRAEADAARARAAADNEDGDVAPAFVQVRLMNFAYVSEEFRPCGLIQSWPLQDLAKGVAGGASVAERINTQRHYLQSGSRSGVDGFMRR